MMFCLYFGFDYLPTSVVTLSLFAQMISRSFKSIDTVKNYISGVKLLHVLVEKPCLAFESLNLKLALRGMARLSGHTPKQALPITKELLLNIFHVLGFCHVNDFVFWSLFLLAFFTMSRKSNLVVTSLSSPFKCLLRQEVIVGAHSMLVVFKWSKTNQFGKKVHMIPLGELKGSPLCPVSAFKIMCSKLPVKGDNPAFCMVKGTSVVPVTYDDLHKFLRIQLGKLGLNASLYSSHSFRRGAASCAFKAGVHVDLIQAIGDWSSDAYKRYLCLDLKDKLSAVNKMYGVQN